MIPITVSASQFRSQMFRLYQKYLSGESISRRSLEVKDVKKNKVLFLVSPVVEIEQARRKRLEKHLAWAKRTRGKIKFDERKLKDFRKKFDQNIRERLEFANNYTA